MSDPIVRIIIDWADCDGEEAGYMADEIRQQIGRELLKDKKYTGINYGFCVTEEDIIEVCKLGEDNE